MINLITGLPGQGKTLYAVSMIIDLAARGETIYTNINGLSVPGVNTLPDDFDWRNTPDGSYIFYDEAQFIDIFKSRGRENVSSHQITADLSIHRHTGHEIYFITQDANYLHKHILGLVNKHTNITRPMGTKFPVAVSWPQFMHRPLSKTADKQAESRDQFTIKKQVYQYYTSASQHKMGFNWLGLFKKTWIILAAIIFIVYTLFFSKNHFLGSGAVASAANSSGTAQTAPAGTTASAGTTAPAAPTAPTAPAAPVDREALRVASAFASSTECVARNGYGERLPLDYETCLKFASDPLQMDSKRRSDSLSSPVDELQPVNTDTVQKNNTTGIA